MNELRFSFIKDTYIQKIIKSEESQVEYPIPREQSRMNSL